MRRIQVAGQVLAGAALALILTAAAADAGQRQKSGTVTGVRGNTVAYNQTTTRGNGVGTTQTNYTGANGKTASSTTTRTAEGNGTMGVQKTITAPNGQTATVSGTVSR